MPRNLPPYTHGTPPRLGVLLTNVGTPAAPTPGAVRRYLAEFLWDPRVVEIPRPLWWLILHGLILRTRPRQAAAKYRQIWTAQGSPLLVHSLAQRDALHVALSERLRGPFSIQLGMRYGTPSVRDALRALRTDNAQRLLILPLYPQYSATTTASVFDAVAAELQNWRWQPEVRFINGYHAAGGYIDALAASVREHWQQHGRGERLVFSFHGLPRRNLTLGDPYHCFCQQTARLVAEKLALADGEWHVSFQSRLGRAEWLKPYTADTVRELAQKGVRQLDVICPGFAADCLETLEEITLQNQNFFRTAGGETLRYIPALNARPDHIRFLADLLAAHAQGWPEASPFWKETPVLQHATTVMQRARGMGAER